MKDFIINPYSGNYFVRSTEQTELVVYDSKVEKLIIVNNKNLKNIVVESDNLKVIKIVNNKNLEKVVFRKSKNLSEVIILENNIKTFVLDNDLLSLSFFQIQESFMNDLFINVNSVKYFELLTFESNKKSLIDPIIKIINPVELYVSEKILFSQKTSTYDLLKYYGHDPHIIQKSNLQSRLF